MTLRSLTPEELKAAYRHLAEAFPPAELKSLGVIEAMVDKGVYDPLGAFDGDGEALGYAFLWHHGATVLLDYLCVPAERRGQGVGSEILEALGRYLPRDTVLLAEAEAPTGEESRDGTILRRLGFYARHGARTLGYDCAVFGVHYKVLCWGQNLPPEEDILKDHQGLYLRQFGRERFDRYVQLPLGPGEQVRPLSPWREE
jgi:GNAT superfamily N-acetyltransferase